MPNRNVNAHYSVEHLYLREATAFHLGTADEVVGFSEGDVSGAVHVWVARYVGNEGGPFEGCECAHCTEERAASTDGA